MRTLPVLLCLLTPILSRGAVPRHECVPVENLPAHLRAKADDVLVAMLDSEALYTVAGGLKPVSDGFWQTRFPADRSSTPEIEEVRHILSAVRCGGELAAGVYVFDKVYDGKRSASAFVAHRPSLRALLARRADVFTPLGIAPDTDPQRVMELVDRGPAAARWQAFGLLFGYPDHAVEFFVAAGESEKATGKFVERDFLTVPTVAADTGRFVYAVPKGHAETDADRRLKASAAPLYAEYVRRRPLYVGADKPGPAYLLRDWFDDGFGRCSSAFTRERPAFVLSPCPPVACVPTRRCR